MPAPAKTTDRKAVKLTLPVHKFKVDRTAGVLADVALMTANREAEGHGLMIDKKTIEGAKEAIDRRAGGQMRSAVTHGSINEYFTTGGDRILSMPGWFEDIGVRGDKLVAARYTFYDYFRKHEERAFDAIMEMAEKTPKLLGVSLELIGYAVYIGTDGTEYGAEPEDVELQYDGEPVLRVVEVYFGAFVDIPAANDGLFAALSGKLGGKPASSHELEKAITVLVQRFGGGNEQQFDRRISTTDLRELSGEDRTVGDKKPFSEEHRPASGLNTNTNQTTMIKKLKELFGADPERLSRAMLHYADMQDEVQEKQLPDDKIVEQLKAKMSDEDREKEMADLRAENEKLKAENTTSKEELSRVRKSAEDATTRLQKVKDGGFDREIDLGANTNAIISGKQGLTAKALQRIPEERRNFAITSIDDLWIPDIWIQGMSEQQPISTSFLGSGAVVSNGVLTAAAQGGGSSINVPFFIDPDVLDEPQVEHTAPTLNGVGSGVQIAPRLNRVASLGASALSKGLSGADPISFALNAFGGIRNRNALRTIIYMLRGLFGNTAATGAFSGLRTDEFIEDGNGASGSNMLDAVMISDGTSRLGERKGVLAQGVFLCHSQVRTGLEQQDLIDTIRASDGRFIMYTYQGIPIIVSDLLARPGSTSGTVYESYFFAPGTVGVGYQPQTNAIGDIASFTREEDAATNDVYFFDRTSGFVHPNGAKWVGTPGNTKGGPTNAELAAEGNWALGYENVENVGIVQIRTNG